MLKTALLATAVMAGAISSASAATTLPTTDTNLQAGCMKLFVAAAAQLEQAKISPSECIQLKKGILNAKDDEQAWFQCIAPAVMLYNQNRRLPEIDRPPLHIRQMITAACMMIVLDVAEDKATLVAKRNVEP